MPSARRLRLRFSDRCVDATEDVKNGFLREISKMSGQPIEETTKDVNNVVENLNEFGSTTKTPVKRIEFSKNTTKGLHKLMELVLNKIVIDGVAGALYEMLDSFYDNCSGELRGLLHFTHLKLFTRLTSIIIQCVSDQINCMDILKSMNEHFEVKVSGSMLSLGP